MSKRTAISTRTINISILRFDDVPYGGTSMGPLFHFYTKNSPDVHLLLYMSRLKSDIGHTESPNAKMEAL